MKSLLTFFVLFGLALGLVIGCDKFTPRPKTHLPPQETQQLTEHGRRVAEHALEQSIKDAMQNPENVL